MISDKGLIQLAMRHMPLDAIHPLATKAAIVAECAANAGHFWDAHDALFSTSARLVLRPSSEIARVTAVTAEDSFAKCVDASEPHAKVASDVSLAEGLGIRSVPTMFVGTVSDGHLAVLSVFSGSAQLSEVTRVLDGILGRSARLSR